MLDPASALTNSGSLLSVERLVVASYDLEVTDAPLESYQPLSTIDTIHNASIRPFRVDYARETQVHIINGMGIALGDSIVGLTAIHAVKRAYPHLSFTIYRPAAVPESVKQLYRLAAPIVATHQDLPLPLEAIPADAPQIDLGNHLFWHDFAALPMIDFFLGALGMSPGNVPAIHKANDWLRWIPLPALQEPWLHRGYTLFAPSASTPISCIPRTLHAPIVDEMWHKYGLPVLGFATVDHPHYTDISGLSRQTIDFFKWIANARYLVSADSAAVHVAAGYEVGTTAFFTTIPSELRVRDYSFCDAVTLPSRPLRSQFERRRGLEAAQ